MNFSPNNEQGILSLVTALKSGMDPSTAYSVLGNLEQQQAQQVAQRQERLGSLAQLLMGAAQSGMSYAGAESLADAAPGPMGPAVQQMMSALYPTGNAEAPAPPMSASGQPIAPPPGYYDQAGGENPMMPGMPNAGPQAVSPAFQPPQPSITEQLALQEAQQSSEQMAAWAQVQQQLTAAKAQNLTPDQAVAKLSQHPEYAAVFASDPAALENILQNLWGQAGVAMAGAPGLQ